jgi:hypothetical protein
VRHFRDSISFPAAFLLPAFRLFLDDNRSASGMKSSGSGNIFLLVPAPANYLG